MHALLCSYFDSGSIIIFCTASGAGYSWILPRLSSYWWTSTAWWAFLPQSLRSMSKRRMKMASSTWSMPHRKPLGIECHHQRTNSKLSQQHLCLPTAPHLGKPYAEKLLVQEQPGSDCSSNFIAHQTKIIQCVGAWETHKSLFALPLLRFLYVVSHLVHAGVFADVCTLSFILCLFSYSNAKLMEPLAVWQINCFPHLLKQGMYLFAIKGQKIIKQK